MPVNAFQCTLENKIFKSKSFIFIIIIFFFIAVIDFRYVTFGRLITLGLHTSRNVRSQIFTNSVIRQYFSSL